MGKSLGVILAGFLIIVLIGYIVTDIFGGLFSIFMPSGFAYSIVAILYLFGVWKLFVNRW